ncbi:hypothetical protein JCM10450v2_004920 [Rhodotorula kratochvilovae]
MLGALRLVAAATALVAAAVPSLSADVGSGISFDGIDTIFSFGDSYSTVGYRPQNGLTPLPLLGGTTSGGYNWVQYLAFSQAATNQSYYDFAQGGATVNNSLIQMQTTGDVPPSFDEQVGQFEEFFTGDETEVKWTGEGSLFTVFFGINDMGFLGLQGGHNASDLIPRVVASYDASISALYARGARNFLLVLVPPTYRSPYIRSFGEDKVAEFVDNINVYTLALTDAIASLAARFPAAALTTYDTTPLFNSILDDAASFGFTVSASSCVAYWNTHAPEGDLPVCEAPLKDYVWMDDYHPTWSVHKLLAEDVLKFLSGDSTASLALTAGAGESSSSPTGAAEDEPVIARRARKQRKPYRRPAHGSARSPARDGKSGHAEKARAGGYARMEERMRRRWAGLL